MDPARTLTPFERGLMMADCQALNQLRPPPASPEDWYATFLTEYHQLICHTEYGKPARELSNLKAILPASYYLLLQSLEHSRQGEDEMAFALLRDALDGADSNTNPWLFYELARMEKQESSRWGYLERCVRLEPRFYDAVIEMVDSLDQERNSVEIENLLSPLVGEYGNPEVINLYAGSKLNRGLHEEAREWYTRSLESGTSAGALFGLAHIYHHVDKKYDLARSAYTRSLQLEWDAHVANHLAWLLFDLGEWGSAEEQFKEIVEHHPSNDTLNQLVVFYIKSGQYDAARQNNEQMAMAAGSTQFPYDANAFAIEFLSGSWSMEKTAIEAKVYEERYNDDDIALAYLKGLISPTPPKSSK